MKLPTKKILFGYYKSQVNTLKLNEYTMAGQKGNFLVLFFCKGSTTDPLFMPPWIKPSIPKSHKRSSYISDERWTECLNQNENFLKLLLVFKELSTIFL